MNPSALREILKLTERPGITSLSGDLLSSQTLIDHAIAALAQTVRQALAT